MPRRDAELKARLLATFQIEADEHLVALRRHLLALADGGGPELVEATFRDMHTLKGAARSVGLRDVERVCACCETVLSALSRTGAAPGAPVVALLEEAVAAVGTLVRGDGEGAGRAARAPPGGRVGPDRHPAPPPPRRLPPTSRPPPRQPADVAGNGSSSADAVPSNGAAASASSPAAAPRISPRAPETIRMATGRARHAPAARGGPARDQARRRRVGGRRRGAQRRAAPGPLLRRSGGRAARARRPRARAGRTGCGATGGRSPAPSTALLDQARRVRMMPASTRLRPASADGPRPRAQPGQAGHVRGRGRRAARRPARAGGDQGPAHAHGAQRGRPRDRASARARGRGQAAARPDHRDAEAARTRPARADRGRRRPRHRPRARPGRGQARADRGAREPTRRRSRCCSAPA